MPRNRREDLPAGWRQPPETTAEPVPLLRPYAPYAPQDTTSKPGPLASLRPSWRRSGPHRRPAVPGLGGPARPAGSGRPAGSPPVGPAPVPPAPQPSRRPLTPFPAKPSRRAPAPLPPQAPRQTPASLPAQAHQPTSMPLPPQAHQPTSMPLPPQAHQRTSDPLPPQAHRRLSSMRRWRPMRAVIGDGIRTPMLWCESGNCIARYTCQDALSERDLRARALAAGWRYDPLGNLACPGCAGTARNPAD